MPNWINNLVRPVNDAAKEFTKKYVVNEEGLFCFGNLVPVPDILSKTGAPSRVVSPEEFQAFKDEHQQSVHCEYEQKGLLYTLDEGFNVISGGSFSHATKSLWPKLWLTLIAPR